MRFPWSRKPEPAPPVEAPAQEPGAGMVPVERVHEIVRADLDAALVEREKAAVERVQAAIGRVSFPNDPMPGAPAASPLSPTSGAPVPIYGYDTPIDYSTPTPPQRRPRSQVSLQTLRTIADTYDVLRACIQHLKREVSSVPLKFVPKDEKDQSRKTKKAIAAMEAFCCASGGLGWRGEGRTAFEGKIIEDLCVVGMGAIFYDTTFDGQILRCYDIDAATIRPAMDAYGWPGPGEEIYEQWVWGVLTGRYTPTNMWFSGLSTNARSWSPYYASPVEWLIGAINSALRVDDWNRRWLTDGNTGQEKIALPDTWTPEQVMDYARFWDALKAGDSAQRQKTMFFPGGSQQIGQPTRKDADFSQFELWLLRRTCSIMGVQPASVGYSGEQYKVSQQDSMESTSQFGVGTLLEFFDAFYTDLAERMGYPGLRAQHITAREEKATERAVRNAQLVGAGIKTINEARQDEGLDPMPGGDELLVPTLQQPLSMALKPPQEPTPGQEPGEGDNAQTPDQKAAARLQRKRRAQALREWEIIARGSLAATGAATAHYYAPMDVPPILHGVIAAALQRATTSTDVAGVFRAAVQPSIFLVRHGDTDINDERLVRGWLDPPLNKTGRKNAKNEAALIQGCGVDEIHTSDLKRAVQTAKILRKRNGTPITKRSMEYRGWNLGDLQGRPTVDMDPIVADYAQNRPGDNVPGGESFNDFRERALSSLDGIMRACMLHQSGTVAVVTHSRVMKLARAWVAAGLDEYAIDKTAFLLDDIPLGAVVWLTQDGKGGWNAQMYDADTIDPDSITVPVS